jgi:hypothetical protein
VVWAGVESIHAARALLIHCQRRLGASLEGFEVVPQASLEAVLEHTAKARKPLEGDHAWHALIEIVADAEGADRWPSGWKTLWPRPSKPVWCRMPPSPPAKPRPTPSG